MDAIANLYARYDDILALIGALVVALQVIVLSSTTIASILGKLALLTGTKADDDFFAWLSLRLGRARDMLAHAQAILPRARFGTPPVPLVVDATLVRPAAPTIVVMPSAKVSLVPIPIPIPPLPPEPPDPTIAAP